MIDRIKSEGFFEKRQEIIDKAKSSGMGELYVIVPNIRTFLDRDIFHLMYSYPKGESPSLENIRTFLDFLLKEVNLEIPFILHDQETFEEQIVVSPSEAEVFRARLRYLIPFGKLLAEVPLAEQNMVAIQPPTEEELRKKLNLGSDSNKEDKKEGEPLVSLKQERKRRSSSETLQPESPSYSSKKSRTNASLEEDKFKVTPSGVPLSSVIQPLSPALFASSATQEGKPVNALSSEQQHAIQQAAGILRREVEKNPGCRDSMLASFEEELERNGLIQNDRLRANQVAAI
jgi:hypothetical protein